MANESIMSNGHIKFKTPHGMDIPKLNLVKITLIRHRNQFPEIGSSFPIPPMK